jgi:hypothetical protein
MRISLFATFLIALTLLVGCGGGSSNPVSAPAPIFSSMPPSTAVEQILYTYEVKATDPAGTNVSYALTSGPAGAALSGSTLNWTPTAAQSRVPNNFVVTATTAAGGRATQSWTVIPNGTIRGSIIDTYWNAAGSTPAPYDLSLWDIAALVPQADGSLQQLLGTGKADGTFEIPNVPAGYYWLQAGWLYWTNSSTFDAGSDYAGRPWSPTVNTTASFDLSGLDAWQSSDALLIQSPNCGDSCNFWSGGLANKPAEGATSFVDSEAVQIFPADAANGDVTYLTQMETIPGLPAQTYYSIVSGPSLVLSSLTVNTPGTTNFSGTLLNLNPQSIDLNLKGSAWAAKFQNVGPSAAASYLFWSAVMSNAFVTDKNLVGPYYFFNLAEGGSPLLDWEAFQEFTDTDAGPVSFTNPFPSAWPLVTTLNYAANVSIPMPDGQNIGFSIFNWYGVASLPTGGFAPLMSPVQNPLMNGASLFTAATSNTTAVALSWSPPLDLAPYGYCVTVLQYDSASVSLNWTGQLLWTPTTSLTVPAGLLAPENTYVFLISALADGRANMNTAPHRAGFPVAGAEVVSAALTISTNATAPAILGARKLTRSMQRVTNPTRALLPRRGISLIRRRTDLLGQRTSR